MFLTRIDPLDLDLATAEELAAVTRAELAVDMPSALPPTAEGVLLAARHGHDNLPYDALWIARDDTGTVVGHGFLEVSRWANPSLVLVFCEVHPQARGTGVGTALLDAQLAETKRLGRSSLLTFTVEDGHAARFLAAHGFAVGQDEAQRRLQLRELDYDRVEELAGEAAERAADYELVQLDGPAPDDMISTLTTLFEAINDAPHDGLDVEPDAFPVERLRQYDDAMLARRQHVYRLLARQRRTGEWAGHTILCVDETRPGYGIQEDTSVRRDHRGHALGMWLKASMLLWMRDLHPELTTIDTWNARSNKHMIAVNEALGCEVSALGVAMQRML